MSQIFSGYPLSFGDRTLSIVDHTGPASYVSGGEIVSITGFGLSAAFEWVQAAAITVSGNYTVIPLYPADGSLTAQTVTLAWYVASTGLQVLAGTNLAGEHIRLFGIGL